MNVIFGMTEMALDARPSEQQRDYLLRTQSAAQRLLILVDDVLDFSKLEVGGLELERKVFELRPWLERTFASLVELSRDKGVEFLTEVAPDVPGSLYGDPERLMQVVEKLVRNAIKFTERGRITISVERMTDDAGAAVVHFSIRDTGIGIAPEQQERIFTVFVQASPHAGDRMRGAGLGLTICARLVDRMGGRIWVESEVGKGSCFHFTTPAAVEGASQVTR
jgi:signal transduction histidine kinase